MKQVYGLLLGTFLLFGQMVTAQEVVKLFNQRDLSGWYAFGADGGKHTNATELFKVDDRMIRLCGSTPGYLMSQGSYSSFHLTAEFKWNMDTTFTRKSNKVNSGLMYLVPESTADTLWPQGIQFQIKEGATGDFILLQEVSMQVNGKTIEPGRSVKVKRSADATKPLGQWNTLEVIVDKGTITQKLNGQVVNQGTDATVTNGRILLQYEGFPIDFRKVELVKL